MRGQKKQEPYTRKLRSIALNPKKISNENCEGMEWETEMGYRKKREKDQREGEFGEICTQKAWELHALLCTNLHIFAQICSQIGKITIFQKKPKTNGKKSLRNKNEF